MRSVGKRALDESGKYQVNENDEAQSFRTGNRACGTPRRYGNDDLADLVKSDFSIAAADATAIEPLSARLALNKLHAKGCIQITVSAFGWPK
jgi:hypothetical protein